MCVKKHSAVHNSRWIIEKYITEIIVISIINVIIKLLRYCCCSSNKSGYHNLGYDYPSKVSYHQVQFLGRSTRGFKGRELVQPQFWIRRQAWIDTTDFTFSEPCIVIHIREKDKKDASLSQFIPIKFFHLLVSKKTHSSSGGYFCTRSI